MKTTKTETLLIEALEDAINRISDFINTDCECDNTHQDNKTVCCLCYYKKVLDEAKAIKPYTIQTDR